MPTVRVLEFVQVDPVPVTVAVPVEPSAEPRVPVVSVTVPLVEMVSAPAPELPTVIAPEFVHFDPEPVTVAVPVPLVVEPRTTDVSLRVPPPEMVSPPVATLPTVTVEASAPAAEIVGPGDRSIVTVVLLVGAPFGVQLVPVAQFELVLPFQVADAALATGWPRANAKTMASRSFHRRNAVDIEKLRMALFVNTSKTKLAGGSYRTVFTPTDIYLDISTV